jgi:hypothetical protein
MTRADITETLRETARKLLEFSEGKIRIHDCSARDQAPFLTLLGTACWLLWIHAENYGSHGIFAKQHFSAPMGISVY